MTDSTYMSPDPDFHRVEYNDNGKAYWMERASRAEALVEKMMTDPPAQMSTPLGLLPIDAEGMRRLGDALGKAQRTLAEISTNLCQVEHDLEGLKKLL